MKRDARWIVVQDTHIAQALLLRDDAPEACRVLGLQTLERELCQRLGLIEHELSEAEVLAAALALLHNEGLVPSLARARDLRVLLQQILAADLAPEAFLRALAQEDPQVRGARIHMELRLACKLHAALRTSSAALHPELTNLLCEHLAQGAQLSSQLLPQVIELRDVVSLTPARMRLFSLLKQSLAAADCSLQVSLPLLDRPLSAERARDALEQLGDRYAALLGEVPQYRMQDAASYVVPQLHREGNAEQLSLRALAQLTAELASGRAARECALVWPFAPSDEQLRGLSELAASVGVPLRVGPRVLASRALDELLRWAQLLAGNMQPLEWQRLLRSPLLQPESLSALERAQAVRELLREPWPHGASAVVLRARAQRELPEDASSAARAAQRLCEFFARWAELLQRITTLADALCALQKLTDALGLARGASCDKMHKLCQDDLSGAADHALLAALSFEEHALQQLTHVCGDLRQALLRSEAAALPRKVSEVVRDLRVLLGKSAPWDKGQLDAVIAAPPARVAAHAPHCAVVLDARAERWSLDDMPQGEEFLPLLQLQRLGQQASWQLLRLSAKSIHLLLFDESGQGMVRPAQLLEGDAQEVLGDEPLPWFVRSESDVRDHALARGETPEGVSAELAERCRRSAARAVFDGTRAVADPDNGLLPEGLPHLASAERPLSPGSVETLVSCPFRGFVSDVLGARAPESPLPSADAREEGSILHALLQAAFVAAQPELAKPTPEAARVLSLGMAAARAAAEPLAVGVRALQLQILLIWVERTLRQAAADTKWCFDLAEVSFDSQAPDAPWPTAVLDGMHFRGRLDRLDRSRSDRTQLRVVDYKRRLNKDRIKLQLPLYALAAEQALAGAKVCEGAYIEPRSALSAKKSEGLLTEPLEDVAAAVRALVVPAIMEARHGELPPRPHKKEMCERCEARVVCRRPLFYEEENGQNDAG